MSQNVQTLFQWYYFQLCQFWNDQKSLFIWVWEPVTIKLHLLVYTHTAATIETIKIFLTGDQKQTFFFNSTPTNFNPLEIWNKFNQHLFSQRIGNIQFVKPRTPSSEPNVCQCRPQQFNHILILKHLTIWCSFENFLNHNSF